ncbi:MAG: radical SAM protein [Candidatus Omnitrophota bacterium]|nr:radical SAM protein [Candidatus Omnitrophota bacterium]
MKNSTNSDKDQFPDVLRIETSGVCNFRCIHCPTGTAPSGRQILPRVKFHSILNQFATNDFVPRVVVLYHGGEPLLNKDLAYFITTLKKLGVKKTVLTTNASLLTRERAEDIIKSGLDLLKVSFDGESPEENDRIRQNGKFSRDAANVKALLKMREALGLKNPLVTICNSIICDKTSLDSLHKSENFFFSKPPAYLADYFKDELKEIDIQSMPTIVWPGYIKTEDFKVITYDTKKPEYCDSLFETITILSNGDVVPCCYDLRGEEVFGNVFEKNIFDIWRSKKYTAFRSDFKKGLYSKLCAACNLVTPRYLCKK